MSKLADYRQLEKHLSEQLKALEAMRGDEGLKKEIEFETKLHKLIEQYGFNLKQIIDLLDPHFTDRRQAAAPAASSRKPRQIRIYKNPNTGELIETKGGNHKALKEWKVQHGADVVERWLKK